MLGELAVSMHAGLCPRTQLRSPHTPTQQHTDLHTCSAMDTPERGAPERSALPADIAALLRVDETGAQFFRRLSAERVPTGLPFLDSRLALRPGVVLEVVGPPGSGKSELLLSIALHVLLAPYADPRAWARRPAEVAQAAGASASSRLSRPSFSRVVVFDMDGKFDGVRLLQVTAPRSACAFWVHAAALPALRPQSAPRPPVVTGFPWALPPRRRC